MTPAEELAAAAQKLRARIDNMGGPDGTGAWDFHPDPENHYPGQYKIRATDDTGPADVAYGLWLSTAVYVTTMHPGVGTLLADWLDAHAADWEQSPENHPARYPDITALAVARAINGPA